MEYKNLGRSGLKVSVVGLGCMNFGMMNDEKESVDMVHKALDLGINLFDTADVYGERGRSEQFLGKGLGDRREGAIIATKFAGPMSSERFDMQGGSRRYIMQAVEASLKRLGTDYIDLYQMHRFDGETPIEESLRALDDLLHQGKVRYIGCSNYAAWQITDAEWIARSTNLNGFVSVQNRYSLLTREIEKEVVPACEKFQLGILPYFPLESGLLTGKYQKGKPAPEGSRLDQWKNFAAGAFSSAEKVDKVEALKKVCERYDHSLLDMAMGWLASQPAVSSVIAGVTSQQQLEQNVQAGLWRPDDAELGEIDEITALPDEGFGPPARK
ncbi:MAG: aldo/keto reductase [Gammaproteobacteria bacterium]|jgi:aryl-alcohol dehydrogenase-like predicted oxidoreductase|nr:aldo/keto reductase [Chromatiales bacterium]MCP4926253.1 aldo/keto reductase [Gammaproteobacteria bacterium]MDP7153062.1 aldo/keto reductase [Gammaproteobacteria bacterium]MDP7296864.1 aldo/keto reductase [Gammaproteobacteria bacterium]MDP7419319.1 aldo/keto reductase [Gammaproteobacteria bacterium]